MAVIAALDCKRQPDAERIKQIRRPRTQRHDDIPGIDRSGGGIHTPMRVDAM